MTIKITPNDSGNPPRRLAAAELTTIILGLRVWQNELGYHSLRELRHYHPELKREEPLTIEEIDALVARLEASDGR